MSSSRDGTDAYVNAQGLKVVVYFHVNLIMLMLWLWSTGSSSSQGNGSWWRWENLRGRGPEKSRVIHEQWSDRLRSPTDHVTRRIITSLLMFMCAQTLNLASILYYSKKKSLTYLIFLRNELINTIWAMDIWGTAVLQLLFRSYPLTLFAVIN